VDCQSSLSSLRLTVKQKYHSLAVKGEKVDLAAENAKRALVNGVVETQAAAEEDVSATLPGASSTSRITNNVARAEQTAVSAQQAAAVSNGAATLPIPQALMATGTSCWSDRRFEMHANVDKLTTAT